VQNATDQARAVAGSIASGHPVPYRAVPWFWSDQGDTHVQTVGLTATHDVTAVIGTAADGSFSVLAFRDGALVGADSVNARGDHLALRRLLARAPGDGRPLTPQLCSSPGFDLKLFVRTGGNVTGDRS
jgi:3-phenylpropionate/trans-cinnamate dioxygenase ferredoxin reductase subunit